MAFSHGLQKDFCNSSISQQQYQNVTNQMKEDLKSLDGAIWLVDTMLMHIVINKKKFAFVKEL